MPVQYGREVGSSMILNFQTMICTGMREHCYELDTAVSRTMITGYKERLGQPLERLSGDVPRAKSWAVVFSESMASPTSSFRPQSSSAHRRYPRYTGTTRW